MTRPVRPWFLALAALVSLALAPACTTPQPAEVQVVLALATVPPDVACLRVTAAGATRSVVREIGVSPGGTVSESFSGLPLGTVVIKGEAFSGDCASVTKTTIAGWASEPETVSIVLGRQSTVAMTLNRNGRAKLNVDFSDEPTCSDVGAICTSSAECCSKACKEGRCYLKDAGTEEDAE